MKKRRVALGLLAAVVVAGTAGWFSFDAREAREAFCRAVPKAVDDEPAAAAKAQSSG